MDLPTENRFIQNYLDMGSSETLEENSSDNGNLEPLLDLLVDLNILNQAQSPSLEPPSSFEKTNGEIPAWQNLLPQTPPMLALPPAKDPPYFDQNSENSAIPNTAEAQVIPEETPASMQGLENLITLLTGEQNVPQTPLIPEEKAQEKDDPGVSPVAAEEPESRQKNDSEDAFKLLQSLLVTPEVSDVRDLVAYVDQKVSHLEEQLYQPQELLNLLLPVITELLSRKVTQSKEEVVGAIAPIIDRVIQNRSEQDKTAMAIALAPLISEAISRQIGEAPEEIATAIAPTMGQAIKEQIRLEQDVMVDALYPIIGNTVSRYLGEAIQSINEQISSAFSAKGIQRKIRAKVQGVSEGELLFKEAIPFIVRAVFLIHKASGLVISEVQPSESHSLESEMVAGMLTAIRSFVNDCIAQSGDVSELNEIEYGNSKIILEVAGYCYLAVVTQGTPPKPFIQKMRRTLSTLILKYGKPIEFFNGDPDTIPEPVNSLLNGLIVTDSKNKSAQPPTALLVLSSVILGCILIPAGIYQYHTGMNRRLQEQTSQALASAPELAVYRLNVDATGDTLKLTGRVPNAYLRTKAGQIAQTVAPNRKLENQIIAVEVPADPVAAGAEVQRVTNILNQMSGVAISTRYQDGQVRVSGRVRDIENAQKITQAFEQIPGVRSVTNTVQVQPIKILTRIYFEPGSAELKSPDFGYKLNHVKSILAQYPEQHLRIIGQSEASNNPQENQALALKRAETVRDALVNQGIDPKRLEAVGYSAKNPQMAEASQPLWLSRYVEFELFTPSAESP